MDDSERAQVLASISAVSRSPFRRAYTGHSSDCLGMAG